MRLNYKRTILVGLAFFIISMFWQTYDTIVPKIFVEKFGMNQALSGFIMALDNILALFLLPLFGHISDRTKTKIGKRKPYVIIGTILAAIIFITTSFADNAQLVKIQNIDNNTFLIETQILDNQKLTVMHSGSRLQIKQAMALDGLNEEDFINLSKDNNSEMFVKYVVPARQAYAWQTTINNPAPIIAFLILLFFVLISMSIYRSPAVALMPDVTPKILRSKGNAVINLMGAVGGIFVLILGFIFKTGSTSYMSYTPFFIAVAVLMLIALLVFAVYVKENEWVKQARDTEKQYADKEESVSAVNNMTVEIENDTKYEGSKEKLSKEKSKSLFLILASVFLWFMGYNAVTSKFSVYVDLVLNINYNLPLLIAQATAIIAFIPIGIISSKFGRKKTILFGIVLLFVSFFGASFISGKTGSIMYLLFAVAGIAWASINVNSFPMVVELCKEGNVGKYTGFYYTASMSAQILTPILSGILMDIVNIRILFPYGALFIVLSFITMFFTKHGDSKPQVKKGVEAFDAD